MAHEIAPETRKQMNRATDELRESGIMERALNVGGTMPAFELPNTNGEMINSADLLRTGNLAVSFYRGVW